VRRMSPHEAARLWSERHPEAWARDRRETLGKNWRNKVFTGTHERVEDHRVRTYARMHARTAFPAALPT
jgi:hypothetical protein